MIDFNRNYLYYTNFSNQIFIYPNSDVIIA